MTRLVIDHAADSIQSKTPRRRQKSIARKDASNLTTLPRRAFIIDECTYAYSFIYSFEILNESNESMNEIATRPSHMSNR